ncbi:unnamed protein product [Symbiodinium sp. CCMP2592]|nr:unnamed protein product [Symbiodinium sp. CCMP2592]
MPVTSDVERALAAARELKAKAFKGTEFEEAATQKRQEVAEAPPAKQGWSAASWQRAQSWASSGSHDSYDDWWAKDSWDSWSWWGAGSWSQGQWDSWGHDDKNAAEQENPMQRVQGLLRRGHTIDQLSEQDLQLVVQSIDKAKARQKVEDAAGTTEGSPEAEGSKTKEAEAANKDAKAEEGEKPAQEGEQKESKEARKKRLHARNMRYYRSLESPFTPKEIKKMAEDADSTEKSVLFESWLQSGENWAKSTLLVRLRNRNSNTKRGLRKWLFRTDMVTKFGEQVTQMMIDAKLADADRLKKEVRYHPDCPKEKEDPYSLQHMPRVPTDVVVPIYEKVDGTLKEVETTVPVLDVHELLDYLHSNLDLVCPPGKANEYWQHMKQCGNPHALNFPGGDDHIPFSLYGDECSLGEPKDKVTGIYVSLTLFKPKMAKYREFLIFAMQDAVMIHDGLRTLVPVLRHIVWSCNVAFQGKYPSCNAAGEELPPSKQKLAGQIFAGGCKYACAELKGDWKWHERVLRLQHTPVSTKCCFLCKAEAQDSCSFQYTCFFKLWYRLHSYHGLCQPLRIPTCGIMIQAVGPRGSPLSFLPLAS